MRPQSVFIRWRIRFAFGDGKGPLTALEAEVDAEDFGRLGVVVVVCCAEKVTEGVPNAGCETDEGSFRPVVRGGSPPVEDIKDASV